MTETPIDSVEVGDASGKPVSLGKQLSVSGSLCCIRYVAWNGICESAGVPHLSMPDVVMMAILRMREAAGEV